MKLTKEETNDLVNCLEDAIEKKGKSYKTKDRLALVRYTALYFKIIKNYLWERENVR
tara:strand:+ start:1352 stop:1522 length:171 start_codon:yes stop_codon:yes gene_type:complete